MRNTIIAIVLLLSPAFVSADPYPLATDAVTGKPLGDTPVIYEHEGRELRFASPASLEEFKRDPASALKKVDAELAKTQLDAYPLKTCVISNEKLGGMGEPVEFVYKNRLMRLCCSHCEESIPAKADKIIARLDKAVTEQQLPKYPLDKCVVCDTKLGDGTVNVVIGSRLIRLCSEKCAAPLNKDPSTYLPKLDRKP